MAEPDAQGTEPPRPEQDATPTDETSQDAAAGEATHDTTPTDPAVPQSEVLPEGPAVPEDEAVPGLAGERTDLAWNRNALSLAVAAAAILRRVYADIDDRSVQVVVFGIIAGAALVWLGAMTWASAASRQGIEGRMVDARHLRRITAATLLLALSALVLSLLPQP